MLNLGKGCWLAALLAVSACEAPAARCDRIDREGLFSRTDERREAQFTARFLAALPSDYTPEQFTAIRRKVRAQEAEELRAAILARNPSDSAQWLPDPIADSADPEVTPPPRPSDLRWYEEHCYRGQPR